jgi:Late competence development protein ComFB
MSTEFDLVHNHHERSVFAAVLALAPRYPGADTPGTLADVACLALNRLPPRYIRHEVDFAFYLSDKERAETQAAVDEAVNSAFAFVNARAVDDR